ncbi:MAG: TlpA disulfide reductase family protein [Burkholderiales bacterium]|nr:TlpA disulfide reductase family protein [Burkholderiales bacterium]
MPKIPIAIFLAALIVAAGAALWLTAEDPPRSPGTSTDPSAGDGKGASYAAVLAASFTDLEGRRQSLGQWQGKLLFINFWATWCAPCKEEMPMFDSIFRQNAAKGVQVVGIAADSVDKVRLFQNQTPVTYPLLPDSDGALAFSRRMGNHLGVLPHTLVFSPNGELLLNKIGQLTKAEMELIIRENAPK